MNLKQCVNINIQSPGIFLTLHYRTRHKTRIKIYILFQMQYDTHYVDQTVGQFY